MALSGLSGNSISECLPARWVVSAKPIQLSVKFTGVSWPSASSKFSFKVAQGEYLPKERHKSTDQLCEEGKLFLAQKQITQPTLYSGHSSRKKKKRQERDEIKFSSDVTSTKQKEIITGKDLTSCLQYQENSHSLIDFTRSRWKGKLNVAMTELAFPDISKGICFPKESIKQRGKGYVPTHIPSVES